MNKLFYLSVQPNLYGVIFENLAHSGLSIGCLGNAPGWVRIVVEKPFGEDLATAQKLDATLALLFKEDQIFRMDHYLGKEALENILAFRFGNSLFEPLWNNEHIERVHVKLFESKGVETREAFFNAVGQLRDVGQNHVLQMLALTLMDDPREYSAQALRSKRAEILEAMRCTADEQVMAQYEGYTPEESNTETYFKVVAEVDLPRWRGVPIVLESGKGMDADRVEIEVVFKEKKSFLCDPKDTVFVQNRVTFRIQPSPAIVVRFWTKRRGYQMSIEPREAVFPIFSEGDKRMYDAYEKILLDALNGDLTLFTSSDEVEAAWRFITPITREWKHRKPIRYKRGATSEEIGS